MTLSCHNIATQPPEDLNWIRINWLEAERSGALSAYQAEIGCRLAPYNRPNRHPGEIESELKHVAWLIRDAAIKTPPRVTT